MSYMTIRRCLTRPFAGFRTKVSCYTNPNSSVRLLAPRLFVIPHPRSEQSPSLSSVTLPSPHPITPLLSALLAQTCAAVALSATFSVPHHAIELASSLHQPGGPERCRRRVCPKP